MNLTRQKEEFKEDKSSGNIISNDIEKSQSTGGLKKTTSFIKAQQQQKLRDQIQQLRNIRQMMFQAFEEQQSSINSLDAYPTSIDEEDQSEIRFQSTKKNEKEVIQHQQQPHINDQESTSSTQIYDSLYRKLRSTVQLLSEALEEQGNLKALLELTFNPSVYEPALQSEILHLSQFIHPSNASTPTNGSVRSDGRLTMSEELLQNIKYRSLLLEREQLMTKVVETRTQLEDEKTKRIQSENELNVTKQLLESSQNEIEALQQSLENVKKDYDDLLQVLHSNDGNTLYLPNNSTALRSSRADPRTPPAGKARPNAHRLNNSMGVAFQSNPISFSSSLPTPIQTNFRDESEGDFDLLNQLDAEDLEPMIDGEEEVYEEPVAVSNGEDHYIQNQFVDNPLLRADSIQGYYPSFQQPEQQSPPQKTSKTSIINYSNVQTPAQPSSFLTSGTHSSHSPSSPEILLASDLASPNGASPRPYSTEEQILPTDREDDMNPNEPALTSPLSYIVLDIDLENNHKDQVIVTLDADPMLLAYEFMEKNQLAENYFLPLSEYITETQNQLILNWHNHRATQKDPSQPQASPSSSGKQYVRRENERSNEIDRHTSNSPSYSNNSPRNQSLEFSRSISSPPDYDFDQNGDAEEDENRDLLVSLTASNEEKQYPTTSPVVLDVSMSNDAHSREGKNEEEYNESEDILSTQLDDLFSFDTSPKSTKSPAFISSSTSPTTQDTGKREFNEKSPSPENKRIDLINPIIVQVPERVTAEGSKKTPKATSLLSFLQAKNTNLSSPTVNALNLIEDEEYIEVPPTKQTKQTKQKDNEETEEEDIDDAGLDELDVSAYEEEVEDAKSIEGSDHDEFDLNPNHPHYRSPYEIPRSVNLPFSPHPSFMMDPQSKHSLFKKQEKPSIYDVRSPIHSQLVAQADPLEEERRKQHSANHDIVVAAKKKFAVEDELDEVIDHYLQEYEEEVLRDQDEDVDLDDDFIPPPPPPEDDDDYVEEEEEEIEYIDDLQELDIDEEYENYDDARETDDYISPKNPEGTNHALTNPSHAMSDISDNSESISTEQLIQHFAPKSFPHSSNMLNVGVRPSLQPLTIPIEQEEDHNNHHYRPEEFNSVFHDIHQDINRMTDVFSPTAMQGVLSPFPMDKSITNEDIGEIIDIALEIIGRADELRDQDQLQYAVPLYNNALKLLELSEYYDLEKLKDEIMNSLL